MGQTSNDKLFIGSFFKRLNELRSMDISLSECKDFKTRAQLRSKMRNRVSTVVKTLPEVRKRARRIRDKDLLSPTYSNIFWITSEDIKAEFQHVSKGNK